MNKTVEKAMEINSRENYPELEIGDVVTLGEVWDGNGDNPVSYGYNGSCSYWINEDIYIYYEIKQVEPLIQSAESDESVMVRIEDIYMM